MGEGTFRVDCEAMVQALYDAALKSGGTDNGPPGPRDQFSYYGAFVLDPDGNNIEAVYRSAISHGPSFGTR